MDQANIAMMISKGYNHHNPTQSQMGKANIHFKTISI